MWSPGRSRRGKCSNPVRTKLNLLLLIYGIVEQVSDELGDLQSVSETVNDFGINAGSPDTEMEWMQRVDAVMESKQSLESRLVGGGVLENWANERTHFPDPRKAKVIQHLREKLTVKQERHARRAILNAIKDDLSISPGVIGEEAHKRSRKALARLMSVPLVAGRKLSLTQDDSITGEPITTEISVERGDFSKYQLRGVLYVAREVGLDGRVITEAKVAKDPTGYYSTELTLDFTGPRFEEEDRNANPHIIHNRRLDRAAATTFSLLANHVVDEIAKSRIAKSAARDNL